MHTYDDSRMEHLGGRQPVAKLALSARADFITTPYGHLLGAILAFLIARYLARRAIEKRIAGNPRFAAVDEAIAGQGLKITTLLRLSPVFPFALLNYGLGLTRVRLRDYVLACFGMLPATFLYVYYGDALASLAAVAGGVEAAKGPKDWAILGIGLAATIAVTVVVTRIAKRALAEEIPGT